MSFHYCILVPVQKYDEALVALEDSGIHERLEKEFVTPPASECSELTTNAVRFQQVSGEVLASTQRPSISVVMQ
jgi:hypothetical protein